MRIAAALMVWVLSTSEIVDADQHPLISSPKERIVLKAAAFHFPPILMIRGQPKNFTVRGYGADILSLLGEALGLEFTYVAVDPAEVKKYGLMDASFRQLQNGEVDIIPNLLAINRERPEIVDISYPAMFQNYHLMYSKPTDESRLFLVAKPFEIWIWILVVVVNVVFAAFQTLTEMIFGKLDPALPPPSKTTQPPQGWQDYMQPDFFLLDSVIFKHRFLFKLLSCGTWGLMMTVLINAYTTDLISFLTAPRLKPMPNNFEELSKRSDLQLNLEKDFAVTSIILNAKSGPLKILGDTLRQNEHVLTATSAEAIGRTKENGNVYAGSIGLILYAMGHDFKLTGGQCRFAISSPLYLTQGFGFGLRKGAPHNKMIEKKLLEFSETRMLDYLIRTEYLSNMDRCLKPTKKESTKKLEKLKLQDLSGAFLILVAGLAMAFLAFLFENLTSRGLRLRHKTNLRGRV